MQKLIILSLRFPTTDSPREPNLQPDHLLPKHLPERPAARQVRKQDQPPMRRWPGRRESKLFADS